MMKKIAVFLMIFSVSAACAQQWKWHNPQPQGNTLTDIHHMGGGAFIAAGLGGSVLKTTDNGAHWTMLSNANYGIIQKMCFVNQNIAFAVGYDGFITKTTDACASWTPLSSGTTDNILGITFINQDTGFFVGDYTMIKRTNNGGATWTDQSNGLSGISESLYDIVFLNSDTGIAVGDNGLILRTVNGGALWSEITVSTTNDLRAIDVVSPNQIHICGHWGTLLLSTDLGLTWTTQTSPGNNYYNDIEFFNSSVGYAAASEGIFKTVNGGQTWTDMNAGTYDGFNAIDVSSPDDVIAVGAYGNIWRSSNGGTVWQPLPLYKFDTRLKSIRFIDNLNGFMCGENAQLYTTHDGGYVWDSIALPIFVQNELEFVNASTGYLAGNFGGLVKTVDGGNTWTPLSPGVTNGFNSLCFTHADTGYVAGTSGVILKTTNGGTSWTPLTSNTTNQLFHIDFFTSATGVAVGQSGTIRRTVDAGATWSTVTVTGTPVFYDIHTINDTVGIICGSASKILRTVNAGLTWTSVGQSSGPALNSIFFLNADTGYIAGDGVLYKTTNGGLNWTKTGNPAAKNVRSIYFKPDGNAFMAGVQGMLMSTLTPVITESEALVGLSASESITMYPNPATDVLHVSAAAENIKHYTIYDFSGRVLASAPTNQREGETIAIDVSALSRGMYIISIITDKNHLNRKLIKY